MVKHYDSIAPKDTHSDLNVDFNTCEASPAPSDTYQNQNPMVNPNTAKLSHESLLKARASTLNHIHSVEDEIMQNYKDKVALTSAEMTTRRNSNHHYDG